MKRQMDHELTKLVNIVEIAILDMSLNNKNFRRKILTYR